MLPERCLVILSVFICYASNSSVARSFCGLTPFHRNCRKVQADDYELVPLSRFSRRSPYIPMALASGKDYEKLRLWADLLEGNLGLDVLYNAALIVARSRSTGRTFENENDVTDIEY